VLKGSRRAPVKQIRAWSRLLGISPEEITDYLAAEHVPDASTAERQAQLRHWTAEAMAIVSGKTHWEIVRLSRAPDFRPDCRWIARQAGVSVDDVNLALTRLLRLGLIDGQWKDRTGLPCLGGGFRKLALAKVRKAAEITLDSTVRRINKMGNPVMQFQIISKSPRGRRNLCFFVRLGGCRRSIRLPADRYRLALRHWGGVACPPQAPNFVQLSWPSTGARWRRPSPSAPVS
jgi:hypothetical protein